MTTTVVGKSDSYDVGDLVAETDVFRIRSCTDGRGRQMLFQIARSAAKNPGLSRNGWALRTLKKASDEVEQHYKDAGHRGSLNYDLGFPELTDSFIYDGQGSRQVNILRFREILDLSTVVPLLKIWKDGMRIDLPSSAWILGKLLKTISFAHDNRIQVSKITGNNILIQPDQHYPVIFDWSGMAVHPRAVPLKVVREEIKLAAALAIKAVGGNLDLARVNNADLPYTRFLRSLATDGMSDAGKAHQTFYEIVDSLCSDPDSVWESGFHEFTTFDVKDS